MMDLGSECSAVESVEDNELASTSNAVDGISHLDADDDGPSKVIKVNGLVSHEIPDMVTSGNADSYAFPQGRQVKDGVGTERAGNSETLAPAKAKSPTGDSPLPTTKGHGLRKWRRIKRDVVKDASPSADSTKALKRVFSGSGNPANPANVMPGAIKQTSEGSVGSVNMMRNVALCDGFLARDSSLESRFVVGSAYAAGAATDSENSEDRSSKSSTAASAPRMRYDIPAVSGHLSEKNKMKNLSGKSVGSSSHRSQQGKGRVESSKKHRGERIKFEKENSHSSVESDSRSSNFVFMQVAHSMNSNRKQSGRPMNFDAEENSDEARAGEPHVTEEVQTVLAPDASWDEKEGKTENHRPVTDPLVDTIHALQSLQEALESEVQKLGEIGKVSSVPEDSTFSDLGVQDSSLSDQFDPQSSRPSNSLESQVLSLTETVKCLESKLEGTKGVLKVKESRVAELEAILKSGKSPNEGSGSTIEVHSVKSREIEAELEGLFKQKIEAEVEYLALTRTVQKLRVAAGDQFTLCEEQEALAGDQVKVLNRLVEAESKAAMLKEQADVLQKQSVDVLRTDEVLAVEGRVFKVTFCFFIQLILFLLVFWLLVLQLSPHFGVVVPT